ncbi:hypothetical protein [Actinomadura sp. 21ATH]|uniref:hypothetical protein n=1 Tax=Actinomadura sp. 21ATH TaxID=1735444 RepID=UPI0035C0729F
MIKRITAHLVIRHVQRIAVRDVRKAAAGDCGRGHRNIQRVLHRLGYPALFPMATVWCDTVLADLPQGQTWRPQLVFADADGNPLDASQVPGPELWPWQLVAARAANDVDGYSALVFALPADPEVQQQYLGSLLHIAACTLAARSS